jgi:ribosomal protein S18 acetylase RimI-like enzyme
MPGFLVERLDRRSKADLTRTFVDAGAEHPLLPVGGGTADSQALIRAVVDFYWGRKSLLLCGVRADRGLASAALCVDAREDPALFALARLAWAARRRAGARAVGHLLDVERQKPLTRERHLEIVFLATVPVSQGQGFGRGILRFLYREALREGYGGVLAVTGLDTPAFALFRSEGLQVEREFEAGQRRYCWMRRAV